MRQMAPPPRASAALHFSAEASDMEHFNLSLGAHLLLWVFPLALVILVFVENFLDRPARERHP